MLYCFAFGRPLALLKLSNMQQQNQNKAFITRYFNALGGGGSKTKELLEKYIADEELLQHIAFFETVFPGYEVIADEMTAEDNRVVVKARLKGVHEGELNGILPTHRTVDFAFAISYEIENEKIVNHWLIADQMSLTEQLGVVPSAQPVH
jgi:predicted ester cyclase